MDNQVLDIAKQLRLSLSGEKDLSERDRLELVRAQLKDMTKGLSFEEKLGLLHDLKDYFSKEVPVPISSQALSVPSEIAEAILGKGKDGLKGLSEEQILERMKSSISTIFETLNQIVHSLHVAAGLHDNISPEKTIRMLIHERLSSQDDLGDLPIQAYLDHIKFAFQAVRQAFEQAVEEKLSELLTQLSPDKLQKDLGEKGLKIGPLYKASLFELYEERFRHIYDFVKKGLFTREVMLGFERRFAERLSESIKNIKSQ